MLPLFAFDSPKDIRFEWQFPDTGHRAGLFLIVPESLHGDDTGLSAPSTDGSTAHLVYEYARHGTLTNTTPASEKRTEAPSDAFWMALTRIAEANAPTAVFEPTSFDEHEANCLTSIAQLIGDPSREAPDDVALLINHAYTHVDSVAEPDTDRIDVLPESDTVDLGTIEIGHSDV
jgi:hypothetical protein